MKFDTVLVADSLSDVPALARGAETAGFDAIWTTETQHDPFLPLALAAEHTRHIQLGTAIAVAFARNPMNLAYIAWDLARQARGRFILGLGTQVKAHIERRFSMPWDSPAPRLREMILALRAIWDSWQNGTRLNFRGEFYKHTLMTPFFSPPPMDYPDIPIFIAGVNRHLCRLAGELCQGFHVHPFHSPKYLSEAVLPAIEEGLQKSGRPRSDIELTSHVFVIAGSNEDELSAAREAIRAQISFYASTPSYRPVMEMHGWGEAGEQLSHLAARGRWGEMPAQITDAMLEEFAVSGTWAELPARVRARYTGLLDRVGYYMPFTGPDEARWQATVKAFKGD